jgi:hypothetical protein
MVMAFYFEEEVVVVVILQEELVIIKVVATKLPIIIIIKATDAFAVNVVMKQPSLVYKQFIYFFTNANQGCSPF